jgi:GTPase
MLPPEVEEGNHEYKRFFKNLSRERISELSTQMNWRLNEGNGIAYYYLGVDDDGSIYGRLTQKQIKYSKKILNQIARDNKSEITKEEDNKSWFKFTIKRNTITKKLIEKRILLLGDTNTCKSTFLAYIIKNKIDTEENKAKNFIISRKHELETGVTSAINYQYYLTDDIKYVFMDTPGLDEYIKTQMKIILSLDYDLVLYFPRFDSKEWKYRELFYKYFDFKKVPILEINLNTKSNIFPNINIKEPLINSETIKNIEPYLKKNIGKEISKELEFTVLQTIYLQDIGWLISGYIKNGIIKLNDNLIWFTEQSNEIKVKSIYDSKNSTPLETANMNNTITISCSLDNSILKYGFITNKNFEVIQKIKLFVKYENKKNDNDNLILYCENIRIPIEKNTNYWQVSNNIKIRTNILNKLCICFNNNLSYYGIFLIN